MKAVWAFWDMLVAWWWRGAFILALTEAPPLLKGVFLKSVKQFLSLPRASFSPSEMSGSRFKLQKSAIYTLLQYLMGYNSQPVQALAQNIQKAACMR